MPKGIYNREKKNILPIKMQVIMDSNTNCCLNCIYFKLIKTYSISTREEYLELRAKCTNIDAMRDEAICGNGVTIGSILSRMPKKRTNCKFFEL